MTDFEQLTNMFEKWGVPFYKEKLGDNSFVVYVGYDACDEIIFGTPLQEHPKIKGYAGFYTGYIFDVDGKISYVGAWE